MLFEVGRRYQRAADILLTAYYDAVAMVVRRSNQWNRPLFPLLADLGWADSLGRLIAMTSLQMRWLPLKLKGWNRPETAIQVR